MLAIRTSGPPLFLAAAALLQCADSPPPVNGGDARQLSLVNPSTVDLGLVPGDQRALLVAYRTLEGTPLPGHRVKFAIFGDPRGSTLSADTAATDAKGVASVQIRAGAATTAFEVRISADHAPGLTLYVVVSTAGFGALSVQSNYHGEPPARQTLDLLYLLFAGQSCPVLDAERLPEPQRTRAAGRIDEPVNFAALALDVDFTLAALVYDAQQIPQAMGCVELPAGLLRASQVLELVVVIEDLPRRLAGDFVVRSQLALPGASRPLVEALDPWGGLGDCKNAPAQLLLDCIIDALDPDDPLDCLVAVPVSETAQALSSQRGLLDGGCRGDTTAAEAVSLDRLFRQRMDENALEQLAALARITDEGAAALSRFTLQSRLSLGPLDQGNRALASHRLQQITFDDGSRSASYAVKELGLPQTLADGIVVSLVDDELEIAPHQFTLGYGPVARQALGALLLAPAGMPASSSELARAMTEWVTEPGSDPGCPAIDLLACQAAGFAQGCLEEACELGLVALAEHLDRGFTALFGPHADLRLGGRARIIDEDGDRQVERLGDPSGDWTDALLYLEEDPTRPASASFVGDLAR
jgi:hypothetical protein